MDDIKISVIVPSFNQGKYIENVIKSVLGQSYNNWELIIQDGASNDNTFTICNEYVTRDNRINFYSEKDKGFADAVNKAISKASGTLAVIQSSDDFFATKYVFENVVQIFKSDPNLYLISGGAVFVDENLQHLKTEITKEGYLPVESLFNTQNHLHQSSTFFYLNRALEIGCLDPSVDMVADTDFWIRMACTDPIRINAVFRTSKIWGAVLIQPEQRSAELSKFYLGRTKMVINYLNNDRIKFSQTFKKNNVNDFIATGIRHCNSNNLSKEEYLDIYKTINNKEYSENTPPKDVSLRGTLKRFLRINTSQSVDFYSPNTITEIYFNRSEFNTYLSFRWFD